MMMIANGNLLENEIVVGSTSSRVVCMCGVRVTTTSRACWYLAERRWLPWLLVSKRSVRFGSGCSEISGAKDSKAVLSCEWPEERSAIACLFAARKR